jgi:hypothetical protein
MNAMMTTDGQDFTGSSHHPMPEGGTCRCVTSYNRDFATDEDGAHMVQGELPSHVRVFKKHRIEQIDGRLEAGLGLLESGRTRVQIRA